MIGLGCDKRIHSEILLQGNQVFGSDQILKGDLM